MQLPLQNQSAQPKGGPRLPAFFTVVPPYAGRPGGFPAPPELGFISELNKRMLLSVKLYALLKETFSFHFFRLIPASALGGLT